MSDEQNNDVKKPKNKKKKPKYDFGDRDASGWLKYGDGIYKHPDKKLYDVRVYRRIQVNENEPPKQFFKRARNIASEQLAIKKRQELLEGLARLAQKYEGKDRIWEDAVEMYNAYLQKKYDDKKIVFSTMENASKTLKKHTSHWNTKWLSDFTSETVENYINSGKIEVREEQEARPATRRNVLKFIRGVFQLMVNKGLMKHNPAKGLYVRGHKKRTYPAVMTHNEMIKLIEYVKNHKAPWAQDWAKIYTVAYLTGARAGELFSLLWSDVKWDSKTIHITKNYDWKTETHKSITKGKQDRTVPMNTALMKYLMGFRGLEHEFILPRVPDWKNGRAAEVIRQFQKEAGVRETKFHGIRGTFVTKMLLDGVAVSKIQTICGHENLETTLLYQGMIGEQTKGATEGLTLEPVADNIHDINDGKKKTS
jgi:integrase